MSSYSYSLSVDFAASHTIGITTFINQVRSSLTTLTGVEVNGDIVTVYFSTGLSAPEKSTLDNIVANHVPNEPDPSKPPYAIISDTTSQFVAATSTEKAITFNTNDMINFITHSTSINPSRIIIQFAGIYSLKYTIQIGGGTGSLDFWLRKNGLDLPRTNFRTNLQSASDFQTINMSFILSLNAGDYLEVFQASSSLTAGIIAVTGLTFPTRPDIASIVLTISKISEI
jgi:hypothetical protein